MQTSKSLIVLTTLQIMVAFCSYAQGAPASWTVWSPWSPCMAPCGEGFQVRYRTCRHMTYNNCFGDTTDSRPCLAFAPCPPCECPPCEDHILLGPYCRNEANTEMCSFSWFQQYCEKSCNKCSCPCITETETTKSPEVKSSTGNTETPTTKSPENKNGTVAGEDNLASQSTDQDNEPPIYWQTEPVYWY